MFIKAIEYQSFVDIFSVDYVNCLKNLVSYKGKLLVLPLRLGTISGTSNWGMN